MSTTADVIQPKTFLAMEGQYFPIGNDGTLFEYQNLLQGPAGDIQRTIRAESLSEQVVSNFKGTSYETIIPLQPPRTVETPEPQVFLMLITGLIVLWIANWIRSLPARTAISRRNEWKRQALFFFALAVLGLGFYLA